jgi:hypothetical protein
MHRSKGGCGARLADLNQGWWFSASAGSRRLRDKQAGFLVVVQFSSKGSYQGVASGIRIRASLQRCRETAPWEKALAAVPTRVAAADRSSTVLLRHASKACPDTNLSYTAPLPASDRSRFCRQRSGRRVETCPKLFPHPRAGSDAGRGYSLRGMCNRLLPSAPGPQRTLRPGGWYA